MIVFDDINILLLFLIIFIQRLQYLVSIYIEYYNIYNSNIYAKVSHCGNDVFLVLRYMLLLAYCFSCPYFKYPDVVHRPCWESRSNPSNYSNVIFVAEVLEQNRTISATFKLILDSPVLFVSVQNESYPRSIDIEFCKRKLSQCF